MEKDLPMALAVTQFNSRAVPVLGYVSQLAHPPHNIIRTELTSILQALSLAGNSMNTNAAYSLKIFLGLESVRPPIYMEACMLRAAFKTFDGYMRMHDDPAETAFLNSDCSNALSTIIPPGWDSSAFCTNLRDASRFRNLRYAHKCVAPLSKSVYEWKAGLGGKSLQKKFYTNICNSMLEPWVALINDKLKVLNAVEGLPGNIFTNEHFLEFSRDLKMLPSTMKSCLFKTLINSWYTSHRMHENELLPCIFGCDSEGDNLSHYLSCDPMWTLAASASSLPAVFLSLAPLARLCLLNRSPLGLKLLSVVFRGYHALKMGHRNLVEYCVRSGNFDEIILLALRIFADLWRHTCAEAQRPTPVAKAKTKARARAKARSHIQSARDSARPAVDTDAANTYSWWIA
jgi:hypothetical protein